MCLNDQVILPKQRMRETAEVGTAMAMPHDPVLELLAEAHPRVHPVPGLLLPSQWQGLMLRDEGGGTAHRAPSGADDDPLRRFDSASDGVHLRVREAPGEFGKAGAAVEEGGRTRLAQPLPQALGRLGVHDDLVDGPGLV